MVFVGLSIRPTYEVCLPKKYTLGILTTAFSYLMFLDRPAGAPYSSSILGMCGQHNGGVSYIHLLP